MIYDRFRFRHWCKKEKHYCYDSERMSAVILSNTSDNIIPEQCTGLKDKNGKLIYEGDIVELTQARNKGWMLRGTRLEVKYNIDRYCGFGFDDGYALTEKCAKNCIVIGNIHENADLIKAVENE